MKRRAFIINPNPLKPCDVDRLVDLAQESVKEQIKDTEELKTALKEANLDSPGVILQAVERFFSGLSGANSVYFTENSTIDPLLLCRAVASGQWSKCSEILKNSTKSDVPALRNSVMGYLKAILLNSTGVKAVNISKAIIHISGDIARVDDNITYPLFLASICLACNTLSGTIPKK